MNVKIYFWLRIKITQKDRNFVTDIFCQKNVVPIPMNVVPKSNESYFGEGVRDIQTNTRILFVTFT